VHAHNIAARPLLKRKDARAAAKLLRRLQRENRQLAGNFESVRAPRRPASLRRGGRIAGRTNTESCRAKQCGGGQGASSLSSSQPFPAALPCPPPAAPQLKGLHLQLTAAHSALQARHEALAQERVRPAARRGGGAGRACRGSEGGGSRTHTHVRVHKRTALTHAGSRTRARTHKQTHTHTHTQTHMYIYTHTQAGMEAQYQQLCESWRGELEARQAEFDAALERVAAPPV
jgi:hypothetical protein